MDKHQEKNVIKWLIRDQGSRKSVIFVQSPFENPYFYGLIIYFLYLLADSLVWFAATNRKKTKRKILNSSLSQHQ